MQEPARRPKSSEADTARRLADYATAFDFLGKFVGCATERSVIETILDLFSLIFSPRTLSCLQIKDNRPLDMISRSHGPFDKAEARGRMLELDGEYAFTPSEKGFDFRIGQGPDRIIIEVDGVWSQEHRNHYLSLALNMVPVFNLALVNAKNFQLLRSEQERLREAISARDLILAVVSHDLRNPLAAIEASASLIEGRPAELIRASAKRMNRLIEDLVDVNQIEAGAFSIAKKECAMFDVLNEAIEEIEPLAARKGVRLEMRGDNSLHLMCDLHRVSQVLCNILGNAVKFAPEKGGVVALECARADGSARFSIADNGPGIPVDEQKHVFDLYWQGRRKREGGVGLGLAIAEGIIEAHGGRIWVESEPGKGATFFFTIPLAGGSNSTK